jgi:hypothetical protein
MQRAQPNAAMMSYVITNRSTSGTAGFTPMKIPYGRHVGTPVEQTSHTQDGPRIRCGHETQSPGPVWARDPVTRTGVGTRPSHPDRCGHETQSPGPVQDSFQFSPNRDVTASQRPDTGRVFTAE